MLLAMTRFPHQPDVFIIEASSPRSEEPATSNYVVHTRLRNGNWTRNPLTLAGMYEVRLFLDDRGVEAKRIALAIENLSLNRRVQVNCRRHEALVA